MNKNYWQDNKLKNLPIQILDGDRSARYPKRNEFQDSGILFLNTTNIENNRLNLKDANFISEEKFAQIKKGRLQTLDIVMTTRGSIGKIALFNSSYKTGLINAQMLILRADSKIIDNKFLFYLFSSDFFQSQLKNFSSGSAQPQIPIQDLKEIEIQYPPLPIQQKIAGILSAYDDLIENNSRRIEILEEMARMLYREWFVKFRFPGHEAVQFVESELGLIPEGWEVVKIENFGKVITGKTPSKTKPEYYGSYMPFIKTPSMHGKMFCIEVEEYLSKEGADSQRHKSLPPNTLIVNCIGALAGSVSITSEVSQTNQQINAVILNNIKNREFLYFVLFDLKETIRQYGSTGATMINLSKGKFESLPVLLPNKIILNHFNKLTASKFELIKNLQLKNINLRKTRDLLLPRLISGEIDVENLDINTGIQP